MNDDLLQPSLSDRPRSRPLYSTTTLVLAGLFGGGAGALAIFALNAARAGRWSRDAWLLVLGLPVALFWPLVWMPAGHIPSEIRLANKAVGIALAGAAFLLHRDLYRAQRLFGETAPNGIGPGLVAIILGGTATALVQAQLIVRVLS